MSIYPVILCGDDVGPRYWPGTLPRCPTPFVQLVDQRSTFETALLCLQGLDDVRDTLVVCGEQHASWVRRCAPDESVETLLEPEARGSAAAVAAAAAWVAARDPEGVLVVAPADHHIPDAAAFARAAETAARAAESGGVVALGVAPTAPSVAYRLIEPGVGVAGGVRAVKRFLDRPKPAEARAQANAAHLWNSGVVIAVAEVVLEEFRAYAPATLNAVQAALDTRVKVPMGWLLGKQFTSAPQASLHDAVLQSTGRALVLPVDVRWSDLDSWEEVRAASSKDGQGNAVEGPAQLIEAERMLVRLAPGAPSVTVLGLSDVAVVGDAENLLVCSLTRSRHVKSAAELQGRSARERLTTFAAELDLWLRTSALPLWWTVGVDSADGGYLDLIDLGGRPVIGPKRARVQARQSFVYGEAARLRLPGDWTDAAAWGLEYLQRRYRRDDGLYRTLVGPGGAILDNRAYVYDQAFVLLALATASRVAPEPRAALTIAEGLLERMVALRSHPAGGFREAGPHPFQANAHMHLLEAALAWITAGGGERWLSLGSQVVNLALGKFIDHEGGFLREFFSPDWSPAMGVDFSHVEPGHQFEWSWLLSRWDELVGDTRAAHAAHILFEAGRLGLDAARGVVVDELENVTSIRSGCARLWPQTEHLRAALVRARREPEGDRYLTYAADAAEALGAYLKTPVRGLWRDKLLPDGRAIEEPAPASSFYHIMGAFEALQDWLNEEESVEQDRPRRFRAAQ